MLRQWEHEAPLHPVGQFRRFLEELFAFHFADQESHGHVRGSLLANVALEVGARDPVVTKKLNGLLMRETSAFESLLVKALDHGEVSLGNPRYAAQTLVGCLHGLLMLARIRNDLSILPQAENELLRLVGILQNPKP